MNAREAAFKILCDIEIEKNYSNMGDMSVMFEGIESGKYDTMAGQVSITDEREQKYTFSDVYGYNAIKMAVRGDDPAKSVEDLQGRKVCIAFGTVLEDVFNKLNATYPEDKQIELVETEGNIYDELKVGHYDAFPITVLSFDKINEKSISKSRFIFWSNKRLS